MSHYQSKNKSILDYLFLCYAGFAFLVFQFGLQQILKIHPQQSLKDLEVPVFSWVDLKAGFIPILLTTALIIACLCARPFLKYRLFRALIFILAFFFESFYNLNGLKTNLFIFWLWSLLALAILPNLNNKSEMKNFYFLSWSVWLQRSIIMMLYFLSGLWKVIGFFKQWAINEDNIFSMNGLSYHLASEIIRTQNKPFLTRLIFENTFLNPLAMASVVLIQLSSIYFVFRPKHIKFYGYFLLLFHIGSFFTLSISYPTNFLLVIIVFVYGIRSERIKSPELKGY